MLENIQKVAEILNNVITPIAIIIGGLWAYRKFNIRNEGQWNANLSVSTETIYQNEDEKLVSVNISIDNIGNKKITPTKNGLTVTLYKANSKLSDNCIVDDWIENTEMSRDILTSYKNDDRDYTEAWNLDSGATYNERVILRIKDNGLYKIRCRLHIVDRKLPDNENWLTEYAYFHLA